MTTITQTDIFKILIASLSFVFLLAFVYLIYRKIFQFLSERALKTRNILDDYIFRLFENPGLLLIYWVLFKVYIHLFLGSLSFFRHLVHFNAILFIFIIAWIIIQFIKLGAFVLQSKLNLEADNNLTARKNYTLIKIFKGIANSIIIVIAIAISLLTFNQAKSVGVSLLTSAGLLGLILGFAAQKSLGMILAGIQLAITQPIRHDDVVIVEGEWGRIEEITLTYVVVKIWDERRLILPVNYFLEKPFQNWTRNNADITGTIFIYVDYAFDVEIIRNVLPAWVKENPNWDGRVVNVQVTGTTERYKEIRILLSSSDASKNWDLRTAIREKLIAYIDHNFPQAFARIRIMNHIDNPVQTV